MRIRTGTDIIEISRVKESIESTNKKFCERVYTEKEREYCESKKMQKYQHYAARFSAKEAVFKAISNKLKSKYDISWTDIEIKNDENGKPMFFIDKLNKCDIISKDISMSHIKDYAIASVSILLEN